MVLSLSRIVTVNDTRVPDGEETQYDDNFEMNESKQKCKIYQPTVENEISLAK
jgi:hypothetical protein